MFSSVSSPSPPYVLNLRGLSRHWPVGADDGLKEMVGTDEVVGISVVGADDGFCERVGDEVDSVGEMTGATDGDEDIVLVGLSDTDGLAVGEHDAIDGQSQFDGIHELHVALHVAATPS